MNGFLHSFAINAPELQGMIHPTWHYSRPFQIKILKERYILLAIDSQSIYYDILLIITTYITWSQWCIDMSFENPYLLAESEIVMD